MKILGICGSLRNGNTEFMLRTVLNLAKERGADTELVLLREKRIEFCRSCDDICSKKGTCIINDDMREILDKMISSDAIILGTPTYFDNVSGLMKNFIDRTNPVGCDRKLKDKSVYLIIAGAYLDCAKKVMDILKNYCTIQKMDVKDVILAEVYSADDASKSEKNINECKRLAEKFA